MSINLSFKKAEIKDPRKLFIYANYKVGKTSLVQSLEDYQCVDVEGGSSFFDGNYIDVARIAEEQGISKLKALNLVFEALQEEVEKRKKKIKHGIIDTATALEDIAKEYGAIMYRKSPIGEKWKGTDITQLPHGAGYPILQAAFQEIYNTFLLYFDRIILLGHLKNSSITKDGKELAAADISLTGKLKHLVCADADAIGYLYRKEANKNFISFKKMSDTDIVTGTRCAHLADQEFLFSEKMEDGTIKTYWNKIYTQP